MTDYTKLVEALREAPDDWYDADLHRDAADAIEALRKRLVSALTALHLANEKMGYYGIQPYTEADGDDMISDWVKTLVHEELEQQIPRLGKWVVSLTDGDEYPHMNCSQCGFYWKEVNHKRVFKNCPNCGAKMNDSNASNASNALNALDNAQDGPIITPCRGCSDYDGYGGCKSKGGCARAKMEVKDGQD